MANRQNKQRARERLRKLAQGMKATATIVADASLPTPLAGALDAVSKNDENDDRSLVQRGLDASKEKTKEIFQPERLSAAFLPKPLQYLVSRQIKKKKNQKKLEEKAKKEAEKESEKTEVITDEELPNKVSIDKGDNSLTEMIDDGNTQTAELIEGVAREEKILSELSEKQDKTIAILTSIENNTKPNTLADREKEIEGRQKTNNPLDQNGLTGAEKGSGILGGLSNIIGDVIGGLLGLKGMSSIKDVLTKGKTPTDSPDGKKKPTLGDRAKGAFKGIGGRGIGIAATAITGIGSLFSNSSIDPEPVKTTEPVKKPESNKPKLSEKVSKYATGALDSAKGYGSKAASVGGKLLGAPLMVATTAYDINSVATNDSLTEPEKNKEYTKIGTRIAAAWAGAKAGGMLGAMGGGTVGAAFGGIGAAPGAAIGGIGGGIIGAIGGWSAGDAIGESLGSAIFDETDGKPDDSTNLKIIPKHDPNAATKIFEKLETARDLPENVEALINGTDQNLKYSDVIQDYQKWVESKGIVFDEKSAGVALSEMRRTRVNSRLFIESKESMVKPTSSPLKNIDPVSNLISPSITPSILDDLNVAESRNEALKHLSVEIEQSGFKQSEPKIIQQPIVMPSSNSSSNSQPQEQHKSTGNSGVPNTRNSDNTIQRLLNNTYKPLLG